MASAEYEFIYILDPGLEQAQEDLQNQRIHNLLDQSGSRILTENRWGRRPLAYEIIKKREGIYFYLVLLMPAEAAVQLGRFVQNELNVIRYLLVKITKAKRLEEARIAKLQEVRQAELDASSQESRVPVAAENQEESFDLDSPVSDDDEAQGDNWVESEDE